MSGRRVTLPLDEASRERGGESADVRHRERDGERLRIKEYRVDESPHTYRTHLGTTTARGRALEGEVRCVDCAHHVATCAWRPTNRRNNRLH